MKTHVITVHGFNVFDAGKNTVAKILPYFHQKDISIEVFDYGYFNIFNPRWRNQKIADKLSERIRDLNSIGYKVIIVAHSNGCTITHKTKDCVIDCAIYINPALDRWRAFPKSIKQAHVWYSSSDILLWISKFLPFHSWGAMGCFGYRGRFDSRITNFDKQNDYEVSSKSHSDVFKDEKIKFFGPLITEKALSTI